MVGSQGNCIIAVMNMSTCAINAGECSAESIVIRRLFLPEGSPEGNNTGDLLQGGHGHARNGYVCMVAYNELSVSLTASMLSPGQLFLPY